MRSEDTSLELVTHAVGFAAAHAFGGGWVLFRTISFC